LSSDVLVVVTKQGSGTVLIFLKLEKKRSEFSRSPVSSMEMTSCPEIMKWRKNRD